ncbi:MAG: nucleotidyltransferase domain-containing protein [bacterium]|nr:nucleotidyltransferase domain-containing protein [bacterium]
MLKDNLIEAELKKYFADRADVAFSFLYGSYARGTVHNGSDVDIAVYFYPDAKKYPVEYEEDIYYDTEDEIWADLEQLLGKEVELLVLNRVSASVSATAIRGIPLVVNDWNLYLDFMDVVTREAEDFAYMHENLFLERCRFEN